MEEKIKKAKRVLQELISLALDLGTLIAVVKFFILDVLFK